MVNVRKANNKIEPFDKRKVIRTCLKFGVSKRDAEKVAGKIEEEAYEGITTKKILKLIYFHLSKINPKIRDLINLREALSLLSPKIFEEFVGVLLREYGYEIERNKILMGKCVEHEIDVIARKDNLTLFVEVKHHKNFHSLIGMEIPMQVNSAYEDIKKGFEMGKHSYNFSSALIVSNSKFSEHAKIYSECVGINCLGWKYPKENSLDKLIERKKLFPVTYIKIPLKMKEKLFEKRVILLKDLIEADAKSLGISFKDLERVKDKAKEILFH